MQSYSDDGIGDPCLRHSVRGGTTRPRQPLNPQQCALHRVVQHLGSQAELARQLGTRVSKIRWWVKKGKVPAKWIHHVARVGDVPVSDLVADWRLNER